MEAGGNPKRNNMQLSKVNLEKISAAPGLTVPNKELFDLPERVLQFGTGVLLRGLPDYFIDKANRQGIFNGRIVVVKSTASGGADSFSKQDGLYTQVIKGIEHGKLVEETVINSSISRVLAAQSEWSIILECAANPDLQLIISNTTEVGIALVQEDVQKDVPKSFPGKLLAFLLERYKQFNGSATSGMVIVPTELIPGNGDKLRAIVLELAAWNQLPAAFISWLETANLFCNSLVDRIVPGKLPDADRIATEKKLGYSDELMILSECFRLWAIEADSDRVREVLSFAKVDDGVVIAPDIEKFRELKLRLLNGTHTLSCGLAYLAGFTTVREAMGNEFMTGFINQLSKEEIARAVAGEKISYEEACEFAGSVLDRFRNPSLDHQWLSITVQYSSKMKMRNIPVLLAHYRRTAEVPDAIALGFAAYLLFMKCSKDGKGQWVGQSNGNTYVIQDDSAAILHGHWELKDIDKVVDAVMADETLWGTDISGLPGFASAVKSNLQSLVKNGAMPTLRRIEFAKTTA